MKNIIEMKKIILLAVAAFVFSSGAFAQVQRKIDSTQQTVRQKNQHRQMMAQLNLTKEQKEKIKEMQSKVNATKSQIMHNDISIQNLLYSVI